MAMLENLSDSALRSKLAEYGHPVGPITETTRKILVKKLSMLMKEKNSAPGRKSLSKLSSGEESASENEQYGGGSRSKRTSMPPPSYVRSRRKVNNNGKKSLANSTISDFRANSQADFLSSSILSSPRSRDTSRLSRVSSYDFDSGSDSDVLDQQLNRSRNNRLSKTAPTLGRLTKSIGSLRSSITPNSSLNQNSRPLLSNISNRFNKSVNDEDLSEIKETDSDSSSFLSRPFNYSYRGISLPLRHTYDRSGVSATRAPPPGISTDLRGLKAQLQEWGPLLLLSLFLLFFVWLAGTYCLRVYLHPGLISANQNHVYPICRSDEIGMIPCIPPEDLPFAVNLYRTTHQLLLSKAIQSVCGPLLPDGSVEVPYMTERQLIQHLLKLRPADVLRIEKGVQHLGLLLVSNPHWGVSVLRGDDGEAPPTAFCNLPETRKALPSDLTPGKPLLFITPCPDLSFTCRTKLYVYTSFYYIVASLIVGTVMYLTYASVRYYIRVLKEEEEQTMALIDRIFKQVSDSCANGLEYIAIRHVHDMLIPPAERTKMTGLWNRAIQFLEKNESRLRREIQTVYGEDTEVWRLLAPASPVPSLVSNASPTSTLPSPISQTAPESPPSENRLYPDLSVHIQKEGQRVWQGEAFETSEGSMNSLPVSPTPCLKIRHMFELNKDYGENWQQNVKNAIIEKCEGVRILHIAVDSQSKEGCVFLKCSSSQEAGVAFKRLHGSWFDGSLVTVKYLRLERYHERFPDSVNLKVPLRPSNNLRLSLGGKS